MSLSAQVKFLRVLQEHEFQRLGGSKPIKTDVRIIAATNRDLGAAMDRADFREDLYYRLKVFEIRIPPLRERPEDIIPLTAAFLDDIGRSFGRAPIGITREAKDMLLAHPWRGNARELRNVLERATIVSEGGLIAPEHLAIDVARARLDPLTTDVRTMERQLIERVLQETRGNKSRAAKRLGLTRKQLYGRLAQYGSAS
jgi:DNA-binding NtrC family response regulator